MANRKPVRPARRGAALLLGIVLPAASLPAQACDPEAMNAELTAVCRAALDPAGAWARALLPRLAAEEAAALEAALGAAARACEAGDPASGARQAAEIARHAGRVEARLGAVEGARLALAAPPMAEGGGQAPRCAAR
jgi:hypothetical protein